MPNAVHIEVISDFACPWCLIGKRRLSNAIEQRSDLDITLTWRPYQLNPDMPREGRNRRAYYREKFGETDARNLHESLADAGAEDGIVFCDTPDAMAPNTLSAHVLMSWALNDKSVDHDALSEKLFHAHHIACENIGAHEVLARVAGEVGMDTADVAERLAGGVDEEAIIGQIQQWATKGVSSVPFYVINGRYAISGAQTADNFCTAFDKVVNAEAQ